MLRKSIVIAGTLVLGVVMAVAQAAQPNLPKDAAEYNAYYAALTETDAAKKLAALESEHDKLDDEWQANDDHDAEYPERLRELSDLIDEIEHAAHRG